MRCRARIAEALNRLRVSLEVGDRVVDEVDERVFPRGDGGRHVADDDRDRRLSALVRSWSIIGRDRSMPVTPLAGKAGRPRGRFRCQTQTRARRLRVRRAGPATIRTLCNRSTTWLCSTASNVATLTPSRSSRARPKPVRSSVTFPLIEARSDNPAEPRCRGYQVALPCLQLLQWVIKRLADRVS
jgi:hypothetical protein